MEGKGFCIFFKLKMNTFLSVISGLKRQGGEEENEWTDTVDFFVCVHLYQPWLLWQLGTKTECKNSPQWAICLAFQYFGSKRFFPSHIDTQYFLQFRQFPLSKVKYCFLSNSIILILQISCLEINLAIYLLCYSFILQQNSLGIGRGINSNKFK